MKKKFYLVSDFPHGKRVTHITLGDGTVNHADAEGGVVAVLVLFDCDNVHPQRFYPERWVDAENLRDAE